MIFRVPWEPRLPRWLAHITPARAIVGRSMRGLHPTLLNSVGPLTVFHCETPSPARAADYTLRSTFVGPVPIVDLLSAVDGDGDGVRHFRHRGAAAGITVAGGNDLRLDGIVTLFACADRVTADAMRGSHRESGARWNECFGTAETNCCENAADHATHRIADLNDIAQIECLVALADVGGTAPMAAAGCAQPVPIAITLPSDRSRTRSRSNGRSHGA